MVSHDMMSQLMPAASPARPPARQVHMMMRLRIAASAVLRRAKASTTSCTTLTPSGTSCAFMSTPAASAISQNARHMLFLRRENQCRLRPCVDGGCSTSRKKIAAAKSCGAFFSSPYSVAARLIILLR